MRGALLAGAAVLVLSAGAARAEAPRAYCARVGTDDALRPVPASMVAAIVRLFGLEHMPLAQARRGTVFRCMGGHVLACNYGANLPCGKANTRDTLPVEGAEWCRAHPSADFVPAYIAGHDSIYHWRCAIGVPVAGGPVAETDARGFLRRYWKRVD